MMAATIQHQIELDAPDRFAPFQPTINTHPAWLDLHPSGFGLVAPADQGELFFYNPIRIGETLHGYSTTDVHFYVAAIIDWWASTLWLSTVGVAVDITFHSLVLNFINEAPESYGWFVTHPAVLNGSYSLLEWLAPEMKGI